MKVIVTGSEGLIGKQVCKDLESWGHELVKVDLALGHDLTDEPFVERFFHENQADGLVNLFAFNDHVREGLGGYRLFTVPLDEFRRYMEINVVALFSVCRAFANANGVGSIVNFSSTYGSVSPIPTMYPNGEKSIGYGVSKAAVSQLTRHLAVHLTPNMRVNAIAPGGVLDGQGEGFRESYSHHVPMGRMANVGELSGMVEFLLSDKASYCTGGVFPVDGGWTAW